MSVSNGFKEIRRKVASKFQWDGKINTGNLLTIPAIIIAYMGFILQKQSLDNRVDKLQMVVDSLEAEKKTRLLQGLNQDAQSLTHFSKNMSYTTNQINAIKMEAENEAIINLAELNKIFDLLQKHCIIPSSEKNLITFLQLRNFYKTKILLSSLNYSKEVYEFDSVYHPKKENYKTGDEFIAAQSRFNDTLDKYLKHLLVKLQNEINEPKIKVAELENQFFKKEIERR